MSWMLLLALIATILLQMKPHSTFRWVAMDSFSGLIVSKERDWGWKQGAVLVELDIANIEDILDSSSSGELVAILVEFKMALNPYLSKLVESPVRSLRDVIAFNSFGKS